MRKVIATEGKEVPGLRTINPGALTFEDDSVPVTFGFETLIGKARDFERNEETGELSVDIYLSKHIIPLEDDELDLFEWSFSASPFSEDAENNLILSGRIRSVTIIAIPGFPKDITKMINDG